MRRSDPSPARPRIDLPGAVLAASAMFLLMFGLTEGGTYGWSTPIKDFSIAGKLIWPATRAVSVTPLVFAASAALFVTFYRFERARERAGGDPLFEFGQLRHKAFRYGLLTSVILAMGQFGLIFALPIFLQDAKHLSAQSNGLWMLPMGVFIIMGAQIGARLIRKVGVTPVVRTGLVLETVGLALLAFSISPNVTFWALLRAFVLFGFGVGFASSQLTNVVLHDIDRDKSGVASGANTTVRQLGGGLGAAAIGSFLTAQTVRQAIRAVSGAKELPAALSKQAISQLHVLGPNYQPPANIDPGSAAVLRRALAEAISKGTRPGLFFASGLVCLGAVVSMLIPRIGPPGVSETMEVLEGFEPFEPIDPDPAIIDRPS